MIINKPITLYFEPMSLEVKFQKCLKLQIAIFRLGTEQAKGQKRAVKMDKTDPVKYTNPQQKIAFSKTLSLLTTLPFNSQTQTYESKQVDFEVALDVDGKKERMGKKINIRDIILAKTKIYKFVQENPLLVFTYRAEVKVQDEKAAEQPKREEQPKKNTKFIRFEETVPTNAKENVKFKQQPQAKVERIDKGRHKTVFFEPSQQQGKIVDSNSEQTKGMKKYRSLHKENVNEVQQKQSKKGCTSESDFNLKLKLEEIKDKYQKLEEKFVQEQRYNQQLQKKIKEKDAKYIEITHKAQQMQQKLQNQLKMHKKQKQELKKQFGKINQQNQVISQLREQIRSYQQQIQKLRKTAHNYQQSTKHIASGSQQQIRALRQRISNLQKQNIEISKQSDVYEQSLKSKDQIISDLKAKIYAFDKENLQLLNKIKSLENKLNKGKEEYQSELQQLQNKIVQMKQENKNFKIATLKDIKDDNTIDYKKKIQNLEKQLQKKQQLLRKMTEMKKQNENQRNHQINNLKKELASIKEINQKLQSSKNTNGKQCGDIQIKIQLQKIKKELDTTRKNEKALLIQKGKLQANNRSLQDDIVKNKCAIANILNAVQQTGNEKLITEVYTLTE